MPTEVEYMDDETLKLFELGEEYHKALCRLVSIYKKIDKQIENLNDPELKDALSPLRGLDIRNDNLKLVHSTLHYHGCRLYGATKEEVRKLYEGVENGEQDDSRRD